MLTLYTFGPAFGLPDPSPFVTKSEVLLKMAGVPYQTKTGNLRRAPKGKLPYIDDDGEIVADSTLIRFHIERKYGFDFDAGLTPAERGAAWAVDKMFEDHFYWIVVRARWCEDENFARGPANFFKAVPAPVRPLVTRMVRKQVSRTLFGQGTSRYSNAELAAIVERGVQSVADLLGDKPYLFGDKPCGADATAFAFVGSALCPLFEMPMRHVIARHANLVAYAERLGRHYYPELAARAA
ncbi:glutathione S-transferase [Pandoraea terrae]|uniref:Glutathione S-transferase n=1 Tax=Pandoraea terrae TaxID=1537710 RepID=A0A5E4ZGF7_9BURK|nr:glutathione S-transferase family protein [Pandoraea terrae]VVE59495.1 glutathione S-transferase [Pandoraea terrae]